jgi:hypothetical protein
MAIHIPDFDFEAFDPRDVWSYPAQRIVHFATEVYNLGAASRSHTLMRFPHPDQRFVIFHEMSGLAHGLMLGAMHLRSHGTDIAWWELQPELSHAVDARLMASNNMALRQLLQLGYVQGLLRQLDMAMRQYAGALQGMAGEGARKPLHHIWRQVLETCALPKHIPLLSLLQLHRDSLSQLGKFCPDDRKDLVTRYQGRTFSFIAGAVIDHVALGYIDDWDFLRFLLFASDEMLHEIHRSPAIGGIGFIPSRYLS